MGGRQPQLHGAVPIDGKIIPAVVSVIYKMSEGRVRPFVNMYQAGVIVIVTGVAMGQDFALVVEAQFGIVERCRIGAYCLNRCVMELSSEYFIASTNLA